MLLKESDLTRILAALQEPPFSVGAPLSVAFDVLGGSRTIDS